MNKENGLYVDDCIDYSVRFLQGRKECKCSIIYGGIGGSAIIDTVFHCPPPKLCDKNHDFSSTFYVVHF